MAWIVSRFPRRREALGSSRRTGIEKDTSVRYAHDIMFPFMRAEVLVALIALSPLVDVARGADKTNAETRWKITGEWEEACSCDAACPCWFDSKPTRMKCSGGQALFIEKGRYGKVKLDGLAIANMSQSPDGQTMMRSYGKWNFSNNYIDARANPAQRKALAALASAILPGTASKNSKTRYVAITRRIVGKEHEIAIGNYGSFRGHLIEGGMGGAPSIVNSPAADPIHREYRQGRTATMTFTDARQNWAFRESNYMHGRFKVDSEQYARFTAGLVQKMNPLSDKKTADKL
jgi:hypothetical protein